MDFTISEQKSINYEEIKKAYLNGIKGNRLKEMFGLGSTAYSTLLKDFREEGIEVKSRRPRKVIEPPRYYHRNVSKGRVYWSVTKWIDGELNYFGQYDTELEAQQIVKKLKANNWKME